MFSGRKSPRLVEERLDGKETRNAGPKLLLNGDVKGVGILKIHRIPLTRTATCIVSHVTSPSCIWVKPVNHITQMLRTHELNSLEAVPIVRQDQYVMAPLQEGIYARARVIKVNQKAKLIKVVFIDEGTTAWLHATCLAKMHELYAFYPWQAMCVALFKVRPRPMHTCENGNLKWAEEDLVALRNVLKDFEFVRIEAVQENVPSNDYSIPVKVNMYGLKSEEEELGVPIDQAFVFNRFGTVHYDRELFDGGQQKIYDIVERREAIVAQNNLERWQMTFPGNDEMKYHLVDREIWWESEPRQIPVVDFEWLKEHQFCQDGKLLVDVEGRSTISPYEFHAHPLKLKKATVANHQEQSGLANGDVAEEGLDTVDEAVEAMITANSVLCDFTAELHTFYAHSRNRRTINCSRVIAALEKGERVYCIVDVEFELATILGRWHRAEILGLKGPCCPDRYFCRLRLVDIGGIDIRPLFDVLEIHPMHCLRPRFCLQFSLHGLKPAADERRSDEAMHFFYLKLPQDFPVVLNVLGHGRMNKESISLYSCAAYNLPDVLFVNSIQPLNDSGTILDNRLLQEGYAIKSSQSPISLQE